MKTVVVSVMVFGLLAIMFLRPLRADDLADCKSAVPERAIPGCTRLLDAGTLSRHNQANAHNSRGVAYRRDGQDDLAIADFNRAIDLNPTFASAYNNRGLSYSNLQQYDLAIADLSTAIRLKPEMWQAYVNRATSFAKSGDYDRAIADNTTVIELNPKYTMAYNNRGIAYLRAGRLNEAKRDIEKALIVDPNHVLFLINIGHVYFLLGDRDRALDAWKDVCSLVSKKNTEIMQREFAARDFFTGEIDGTCDDRMVEAFERCSRARCYL